MANWRAFDFAAPGNNRKSPLASAGTGGKIATGLLGWKWLPLIFKA